MREENQGLLVIVCGFLLWDSREGGMSRFLLIDKSTSFLLHMSCPMVHLALGICMPNMHRHVVVTGDLSKGSLRGQSLPPPKTSLGWIPPTPTPNRYTRICLMAIQGKRDLVHCSEMHVHGACCSWGSWVDNTLLSALFGMGLCA